MWNEALSPEVLAAIASAPPTAAATELARQVGRHYWTVVQAVQGTRQASGSPGA